MSCENDRSMDEMTEKELQTVCENEGNAPQKALALRILTLRAVYPVAVGFVLLITTLFYSVLAAQGGKRMWFSAARLCFNCMKNAREFLLSGKTDAGQRSFYIMLLVGAAVTVLCFLAAVAFGACSALFSYRAMQAAEGSEAERQNKILFRVLFPNRVAWLLPNLLYLPLVFFPEYFSAVCTRFLEISGGSTVLFVICNVGAIVAGVLLVGGAALSILERRLCRGTRFDMLTLKNEKEKK